MPNYSTPQAFNDLFFDFTGHAHRNYPANRPSIAQDLSQVLAEQSSSDKGPLIVANSIGIYVYSGEPGHELITSAEYRAAPNSGFYEVTSVSHVGPAIAYLGVLHKYGSHAWQDHIEPLIQHLSEVRAVNAKPISEHWLTELDCVPWRGHEQAIKQMIDYACALAGNYLMTVLKNKKEFCSEHIVKNFLEVNTTTFPIGYNTVMIGTFALAGLKSAYDLYCALSSEAIHWQDAKILLHNLAGVNYSAGLTQTSNWLYPMIRSVASSKLDPERVIIVPYAKEFEELGQEKLSDETFKYLAYQVWGSIYARPTATNEAFGHIEDIVIPQRAPIPGDYEMTKADQIDHFIKRLKFSTGNIKEMLSNTVGFWLAGEAAAKNWQFDKMDIPGLTHGLPEGLKLYPDNTPEFKG